MKPKYPIAITGALVLAALIVAPFGQAERAYATTCGFGTDIGGGQCRGYLTDTDATTWEVPADWNSADNTIEAIGGGGTEGTTNPNGVAGGGGGGGYSKTSNATLTPGSTVGIQVGSGGLQFPDTGDGTASFLCSSTSNCADISGSAVVVGANPGLGGTATAGGLGGTTVGAVGDVKYAGGNGGDAGPIYIGGAGGGAAGPLGDGGDGGNTNGVNSVFIFGGGGGGNGGGTDGTDATPSDVGVGGDNADGTGGGEPYTDGTDGGGGGGGDTTGISAGNGGTGTEWDATHGSGGGGGAAYTTGAGALYGGGSSSGSFQQEDGAQGIIVITYSPSSETPAEQSHATALFSGGTAVLNEGTFIFP